MSNPLAEFTDEQLRAELGRRSQRRSDRTPAAWCDECQHFNVDHKEAECARGHTMQFHMPEGPSAPFGFYRRHCRDRAATGEPT